MQQEASEELRIRLKLTVLEWANHFGVTEACREFNVCSDPKKLDTKVPVFSLARVLAVEPANSAQIRQE